MVDDCGWLFVSKEVLSVQLSVGAWYGLLLVWLERCRDGSYVVNALRCYVGVVCTCIAVYIVTCFICFWGSVFWWKCIPSYMTYFTLIGKVLSLVYRHCRCC